MQKKMAKIRRSMEADVDEHSISFAKSNLIECTACSGVRCYRFACGQWKLTNGVFYIPDQLTASSKIDSPLDMSVRKIKRERENEKKRRANKLARTKKDRTPFRLNAYNLVYTLSININKVLLLLHSPTNNYCTLYRT